jgi:hypothetical protein
MTSTVVNPTPNPAAPTVAGSALAPIAASSHAAAQAGEAAVTIAYQRSPNSAIKMAAPITSAPILSETAMCSSTETGSTLAFNRLHHDIYFRLKVIVPPSTSTHKFAHSNRLCVSLLAQLADIPSLASTGLFAPGKIRVIISKHVNASTKSSLYTASFFTPLDPEASSESLTVITDLILEAQTSCTENLKLHQSRGFTFSLPIITPNGNSETKTCCSFSYDRESLLSLTTIDFQVKIPSAVSISPQEDFALLICQLFTPRGSLSEAEFLTLTRTDRTRFAKCCTPRKANSTKHGDWMDELMLGTFSLNFEDSDSRDSLIWNFLIFAVFFGLDPRFGHHQQYQLFIPTLYDSHQLDRRPAVMRDAVKSFKANQAISELLPAKPRRIRPKGSDASSSDTEGETLFLDNILRRSEAILLLREVNPFDSRASLHFPPLNDAPFTHVLNIPQAPTTSSTAPNDSSILPSGTAILGTVCATIIPDKLESSPPTIPPVLNTVECMNWNLSASCKYGAKCRFLHNAASMVTTDFIGEGKRDKACIKFSQNRCHRGDRCVYKHDLRDGISPQALALSRPLGSPSTSTRFASRGQMASPARGTIQLTNLLNALEKVLPVNGLCESLFASNPLLTTLVTIAPIDACDLPSAIRQLASSPHIPPVATLSQFRSQSPVSASSALQTLSLVKISRVAPPPPSRLVRSVPALSIVDFNGYCVQGHRIFKRTPIRPGSVHACSFCKVKFDSDIFTCFCGASHACLPCLSNRKTAPSPPQCYASFCSGTCTIESVTKTTSCWNGGHDVKKGVGAWRCNTCKFLICRACSMTLLLKSTASEPPTDNTPPAMSPLTPNLLPSAAVKDEHLLPSCSAITGAPMTP